MLHEVNFFNLTILFWRPRDHSSVAAASASVSLNEADVPLGRGAAGLRGTQTQTGRDGALVGVQLLDNMALSIPTVHLPLTVSRERALSIHYSHFNLISLTLNRECIV